MLVTENTRSLVCLFFSITVNFCLEEGYLFIKFYVLVDQVIPQLREELFKDKLHTHETTYVYYVICFNAI